MKKIKIITTGGTIAMGPDETTHQMVPQLSGADLLQQIPQLESMAQLELIQYTNLDSSQLQPESILELSQLVENSLAQDDISGVIITHGTDTLEETAYLLDLMINHPKPVVLTGALRSFKQPSSDATANLIQSLQTILEPHSKNRGVLVVLNNLIHAARFVAKTHTNKLEAISSLHHGPLGTIDHCGVHYFASLKPQVTVKTSSLTNQVEIIKLGVGSTDNLIQAALDAGCQGLVIEAFGVGTLPYEVTPGLQRAKKKRVPVVITSRAREGRVYNLYGASAGEVEIADLNLIFGENLTSAQARLLLMLLLSQDKSIPEIREFINLELKT
ncbi:asparaginase [Halanaerobaculum tunisiense]